MLDPEVDGFVAKGLREEGVKELANPTSCLKGVVEDTLFSLAPNKDDGWEEMYVLPPLGRAFASRRPWDRTDEEGRSENREGIIELVGLEGITPTERSGGVLGRLG